MTQQDCLILEMLKYDEGMAKQIQHFMKVFYFAHLIGCMENLPARTQQILETAAILHDIGIRNSLQQFGNSAGYNQERLGPPEAKPILEKLGYDAELIERVCYLIGHHHTYSNIDGLDYQILVEADFLVNLFEDNESLDAARSVYNKIFKTSSGKKLLAQMFFSKELLED